MTILRELELLPASVPAETRFVDAAWALLAAHTSAIAVVDSEDRVLGLFTDDDLLRGLFPRYLGELRHTAFLVDEGQALPASLERSAAEPVSQFMREPVTVEIEASAAHIVERFLHTPWGAIAVVDGDRFVGMLAQLTFTERLLHKLGRRSGTEMG